MNERFLFRGKSKSSGKWVFGSLIVEEDGRMSIVDKAGCLDVHPLDFSAEEVIPETVGQCTGQNAMSGGCPVFEGDLVDVYNPMTDAWNRCVVKWEKDASGYVCLYVNPDTVEKGCFLASASGTYFDGGYCRIVGNIHDQKQEESK